LSEADHGGGFANLFEEAPCGYLLLTPDGRISLANRTLADWLGRTAAEMTGLKFHEILTFGGRIAVETHLAPMLRLQGIVGEIALDLIGEGGDRIPVIANAAEKRTALGDHLETRITLFRAVDRRKFERSLIAARDEANAAKIAERETAILREQFIAVLGHDLRNPLAALSGGTRMLRRETLSDRGLFLLGEMEASAARANALIDNVLDFARGRLGGGLVLSRDADEPLTPVLQQIVAEVRNIVPHRNIVADFAIREPVDCDRQRMGQLAANLLSNAVAHGAANTAIELKAYSRKDQFILSVTNGGAPIPTEAQASLFQPFFRGEARRSQQGLGLGLFIVSEIAKAHGGEMDVQSDEAATRFRFSMPQPAD
jgi:phosphoserine phosphatase RsbU/P